MIGYESRRKLDTLSLFYDFISDYILFYVVFINSVHYHTEIACSEPIFHAYVISLFVGWRTTWTYRVLHPESCMLWCRSCGRFKCQFVTVEWESWDLWQYVSAYPSTCLNSIQRDLEMFRKQEPSTWLKPQNSLLHGLDRNCRISSLMISYNMQVA